MKKSFNKPKSTEIPPRSTRGVCGSFLFFSIIQNVYQLKTEPVSGSESTTGLPAAVKARKVVGVGHQVTSY